MAEFAGLENAGLENDGRTRRVEGLDNDGRISTNAAFMLDPLLEEDNGVQQTLPCSRQV